MTTTLPNGTVNLPYATTVGGIGGVTPYSWSATPALPANLAFDQRTGAITGIPATQGTTALTFTLQDSSSPPAIVQQTLSLTSTSAPVLPEIITTSLPNGAVGQGYSHTIQVTGGTGAVTWSLAAGALPQNLSLNATTGVISGTPTAAGSSSFTVRVVDTAGQTDAQPLSILVDPGTPPNITTTTLPGGTVSQPYTQVLQATGGIGARTWSLAGGSLPANLALSSTGIISGIPTNSGASNFTVRVTDALSLPDTQALSITITAAPSPLAITTNSLPEGERNEAYAATLAASGGSTPYSWSVTPALPAGLMLGSAAGVISGTPTSPSNANYTFTVRDSTGQATTKQLNLRIRN